MGGCDDVSRKTTFMTTTFSKLYYDKIEASVLAIGHYFNAYRISNLIQMAAGKVRVIYFKSWLIQNEVGAYSMAEVRAVGMSENDGQAQWASFVAQRSGT